MSIIQINTAFNIDLEFEIAEFHKRLLAYIIDYGFAHRLPVADESILYDGIQNRQGRKHGFRHTGDIIPCSRIPFLPNCGWTGKPWEKDPIDIRVIRSWWRRTHHGPVPPALDHKIFEWPFPFGYIAFPGSTWSLIFFQRVFRCGRSDHYRRYFKTSGWATWRQDTVGGEYQNKTLPLIPFHGHQSHGFTK